MANLRRFCIAFALGCTALMFACSDDSTAPPTNQPEPKDRTATQIRDVDYQHARFFYFDDPAIFVGPNGATVKIYRSVTAQDLVNNPSIVTASGWAAPDPEGWGHGIADIVLPLNAGELPTAAIDLDFELLTKDVDYTFIRSPQNNAVIGFALTEAVPDRALAVSYVTIDGWLIGGTYDQTGVLPVAPDYAPDRLALELIKPPVLDPNGTFPSTWKLEMRNVYDIGMTNIDGGSLEVKIEDVLSVRTDPSIPNGSTVPYLRIFGLDQFDGLGGANPDGKFDVIAARVDLEKGLIFFPLVQAFHPDASHVNDWTDGAFAFTGSFQEQYDKSLAIYTEALTPTRENEVHQYVIRVLSRQE